MSLSEKDPAEIVPITFEFKNLTSAPTSPVVTVTQIAGPTDTDVSAMAVGSPVVVGSQVRQIVGSGVHGADYELQCTVNTAEGYRYIAAGSLPVREQ